MQFRFNCDPKYYKNSDLYNVAITIDFSELRQQPTIKKSESNDDFIIEVADDEVREMQTCINEDIVGRGMDDQDTINETGKMLYWLYDEILYQKKQN